MTARDDLRAHLVCGTSEGMRRADELLDAYRTETLRAAADDVIASDLGPRPGHTEDYGRGWSDATLRASSRLLAQAQKGEAS